MKIKIDRTIEHPAFAVALSTDFRKIAISGCTNIAVYSLADYSLVMKIPAKNVSSMVYLSDDCSMLIQNTTGSLFLWDGTRLKRAGKLPEPEWTGEPLHYGDDAHIFWNGSSGIWCYDATTCNMKQIFVTEGRTIICGCSQGIIRFLTRAGYDNPPVDEQNIQITEMLFDGTILRTHTTSQQLKTRSVNRPAWSEDGIIAVSTVAAPTGFVSDLTEVILYEFTPQGRARIKEVAGGANPWSPPHAVMYLMDDEGQILLEKHYDDHRDSGNLYCGHGLLAKSCFSAGSVSFMTIRDLEIVGIIDKNDLAHGSRVNPPTFVLFLPDKRILVGSWNKLLVCQFEPSQANATN